MPEYLAPGVFIEEIERGPKPIEGVATSTAAFLGETARGPVKPKLITSYANYLRFFGDIFEDDKYMPYAVKAFFDNGGRRTYIARITAENSIKAQTTIDAYVVRAVGSGEAGNRTLIRLSPGSTLDKDGNPFNFRVQAYYWDRLSPDQLFDPEAEPNKLPRPSLVEDFDDLSSDPDSANYYRKRINNFQGNQINEGSSGLIEIQVADGTAIPTDNTLQAMEAGVNGDPVGIDDYQGTAIDPNDRKGLAALNLDRYRDVAIVHAHNAPDDVVGDVINHCERNRFRFAVIDSEPGGFDAATDPRRELRFKVCCILLPLDYY